MIFEIIEKYTPLCYNFIGDKTKMKEQFLRIENIESFEPKQVFECGQCFRWNEKENGSYSGIFGKNVLNVKKVENGIQFKGICDGDIKEICIEYFDLNRDYKNIKETLSKVDENVKTSIAYGSGIRLLNQDLWETLISFIISANNNIPRIKKIIERLSKEYGKEINWNGEKFYTFPTAKELEKATVEDYRKLGLGFRDKYIYSAVKKTLSGEMSLEQLQKIQNTESLRNKLMEFSGVGEKVADCVLLFSTLKRLDSFPVDVWVRRVMGELYFPNINEKDLDKKQIQKLAKEKYADLAGIAQQYLFYWKREA